LNIIDRVVVVTGGGSGIGAAMARRFAEENPRGLIVADLDLASATSVASDIGATAVHVDVADPESNDRLIDETEDRFGPVDLFVPTRESASRAMSRPLRSVGISCGV